MTPIEQLARKVVEAIFDRAEEDGALHKDRAIDAARRVLLSGFNEGMVYGKSPAQMALPDVRVIQRYGSFMPSWPRQTENVPKADAPEFDVNLLFEAAKALEANDIPLDPPRFIYPTRIPVPTTASLQPPAGGDVVLRSSEDIGKALVKAVGLGFRLPSAKRRRTEPGDLPQLDD